MRGTGGTHRFLIADELVKKFVCKFSGFVNGFIEDGEVAHFAALAWLAFVVEVQFHARVAEEAVPIRFDATRPAIAEDVDHDGGAQQIGAAKGQACGAAYLLFKLAGEAGVDGVMAAVVWARSKFVYEQFSVHVKHFDGEKADDAQCFGNAFCQFRAIALSAWGKGSRNGAAVQNMVAVLVFRHGESCHFAAKAACDDDGAFGVERDPFFEDTGRGAELAPDCLPAGNSVRGGDG